MTETLQSFWNFLSGLIATPAGTAVSLIAAYLLLQLVILPKLGIQT